MWPDCSPPSTMRSRRIVSTTRRSPTPHRTTPIPSRARARSSPRLLIEVATTRGGDAGRRGGGVAPVGGGRTGAGGGGGRRPGRPPAALEPAAQPRFELRFGLRAPFEPLGVDQLDAVVGIGVVAGGDGDPGVGAQ